MIVLLARYLPAYQDAKYAFLFPPTNLVSHFFLPRQVCASTMYHCPTTWLCCLLKLRISPAQWGLPPFEFLKLNAPASAADTITRPRMLFLRSTSCRAWLARHPQPETRMQQNLLIIP